jgi:hypothetical protein
MNFLDIDLDHWIKLASLVGTGLAWLLNARRRARIEAFFTHGASHLITGTQVVLNSHSLVVRNSGRLPALHVRIVHGYWDPQTSFQIIPNHAYTTQVVQPSGSEIMFERLRPGEQITLSYIYPHPTLIDNFQTRVVHDEGVGYFLPITHARIIPTWGRFVLYYLLAAGFAVTLYAVLKVATYWFLFGMFKSPV